MREWELKNASDPARYGSKALTRPDEIQSFPQISSSPAIDAHLKRWRDGMRHLLVILAGAPWLFWRLGQALAGELDGVDIKSLFVYNSNPAVAIGDQHRVKQGLARDDLFVVVSEHFMTDTADLLAGVPLLSPCGGVSTSR